MKNGRKKLQKQGLNIDQKIKFNGEKIIENALNLHATDVHIEPREDYILVRFRIHGELQTIAKLPTEYSQELSKYFKFLAGFNFSEKTFTQISTIQYGKARIRISIAPIFLGEKITLRLMRARTSVRKLSEIGLWGENLRRVQQAIMQPRGIILTVGDGKNTTNFALLNELNSTRKNIITIEKAIEKRIEGINQMEIKPRIGLNYYELLKSALSQNPDIILIDNLSDTKTAKLAFEASMNGKLIIASLPIQKSSEVIPFFEYLGIAPFLINTNILAIIGQRLVRTVSSSMIEFSKINSSESKVLLNEFNVKISKLNSLEKSAKKYFEINGKNHTSVHSINYISALKKQPGTFIGTTGIFEVISLIDGKFGRDFKSFISSQPNTAEVEDYLYENHFISLKIDGLVKSLIGQTTLKEIINRTGF